MYRKNFPFRKLLRKGLADARKVAYDKLSLADKIAKAVPNSRQWFRLIQEFDNLNQ